MMAPQKRSLEEAESLLFKVNSIVFDIEGTTTPVSFVRDTLFPYARTHVNDYLTKNYEVPEVQKAISALRDLAKKDKEDSTEGVVEIPAEDAAKEDIIKAVSDNVKWQMDSDRKSTELKNLQGMIWSEAYENKEVKGELFEDVGPMLKMLAAEGLLLYVFSSGSKEAQRLLFTHSSQGDLSGVFTNYFDTTIGKKTDKASYEKINKEIESSPGLMPGQPLYLTDAPEEAEAALEAGMKCALVIRPGNDELTDEHLQKFACIERFDELYGDEDDEEDMKRFAGDNGEADDDEDDDDEVDEEDDDGENEDDEENPEDA